MTSIQNLKPNDYIEIPGRFLMPARQGTFLYSVKEIETGNNQHRIFLYDGSETIWLSSDQEFKPATTTISYSGIPSMSRQSGRNHKGVSIE